MSVADAIARKNFRRAVEAENKRTTHLPSLAQREAATFSLDDACSLPDFLSENGCPLRFDPANYGHDIVRLLGAVDGRCLYECLVIAAGWSKGGAELERKITADCKSFDRQRVSTDLYFIDLCETVRRRGDELIDLCEENPDAEVWQPPAALAAELDRLTDEAEAVRAKEAADEITKDKAECAAQVAEWDAEDKAEHAEMIAAGSVVNLKDYKIAKSKRDLPKPSELAWREFETASARLVEAKNKVTKARGSAELNAAIKERVAAQEAADLAKEVAHFLANDDKEFDAVMAKVNARAAEIKADVLSAVAASRPKYPPPSNTPLISAEMANKIAIHNRTASDWVDIDAYSRPVAGNSDNVRAFLIRADVRVRLNAWTERKEISKAGGPWITYADHHDDELLTLAADNANNFRPSEALFRRVVHTVARENTIDPALDRLAELESKWDGTPRLATWLSETCGTPQGAYYEAVGLNIIGGMVRRIRQPGCKHDTMAVFVSEVQGFGKSTLAGIIALDPEWFTDSVKLGDEPKELILSLRGKSVAEIPEMRNRGDVEATKAMISRQTDEGRVAYGREATARARRNIFWGTSNNLQMLDDPSGNRRFLPVIVNGEANFDWLRANIEQLVGEAAALESKAETFQLPREVWAEAAARQEAARQKSDVEVILEQLFPPERGPLIAAAAELLMYVRSAVGHAVAPKQLAAPMRRLGFVNGAHRIDGATIWAWRRGSAGEAVRILGRLPPSGTLPMPDKPL